MRVRALAVVLFVVAGCADSGLPALPTNPATRPPAPSASVAASAAQPLVALSPPGEPTSVVATPSRQQGRPAVPDVTIADLGPCDVTLPANADAPMIFGLRFLQKVAWTADPPFTMIEVSAAATTVNGAPPYNNMVPVWGSTGTSTDVLAMINVGPAYLGQEIPLLFVVDPRNLIVESNEHNNATTLMFKVPTAAQLGLLPGIGWPRSMPTTCKIP